jgi:transcription elongation GreA/GreB family factor
MSVVELKQEITRLGKRGREEIHAHLVRLQHDTPEWKRAAAHRVRSMQRGQETTAAQVRALLRSRQIDA